MSPWTVCRSCRSWPCRCAIAPVDADAAFERVLAIRAAAIDLSPEYVMWLDGEGEDLEPVLAGPVRARMRALVDEMDTLLDGARHFRF